MSSDTTTGDWRLDELVVGAVIGVAIALLALIGHGIWLILSKLFSLLTGAQAKPPRSVGKREQPTKAKTCPQCLAAWPNTSWACPACGWPDEPARDAKLRRAINEFTRRIDWLKQQGEVDDALHARLLSVVEQERSHLATSTAPGHTRPVEVPRPPAVAPKSEEILPPQHVVAAAAEPSAPAPPDSVPPPVTRHKAPAERVEQYAARREAAAAAAAKTEPAAPAPSRKQPLAKLLSAFMEEKNIRWGELVGGLLIVCSSIALVISFWAEIADRPFLKFFTFNGVTAALFGAGFYTYRRWDLHTTSRGLLITAAMLVPLNFLSLAAFTTAPAAGDLLVMAGEFISIALFASLLYFAAQIVIPGGPIVMTCGS